MYYYLCAGSGSDRCTITYVQALAQAQDLEKQLESSHTDKLMMQQKIEELNQELQLKVSPRMCPY